MGLVAFALLMLVTVAQHAAGTAPNLVAENQDRNERQVTIPTAVPASCTSKLSEFSYPSACPSYTIGQSFSSFLTSTCQTFCQSQCIDPFLKYMESCNLDTTDLKLYCASAPNGQPCCSLLTSAAGLYSALTFYAECNAALCPLGTRSTCTNTYNKYGCCLENFNFGDTYNGWSGCGLAKPSQCLYEPWPLPISKEVLIAITAGGGGGLLLLCVLVCCCCVCCCCLCGTRRNRTVIVTSSKMKPFA